MFLSSTDCEYTRLQLCDNIEKDEIFSDSYFISRHWDITTVKQQPQNESPSSSFPSSAPFHRAPVSDWFVP